MLPLRGFKSGGFDSDRIQLYHQDLMIDRISDQSVACMTSNTSALLIWILGSVEPKN